MFQPGRDDGLAFRFGHDLGVGALVYLALSLWPLGDVERAIFLIDSAQGRMASVVPVGTRTYGKSHAAMFELMRGDHSRAAQNAVELGRLAREYDLNRWRAYVMFFEGWANAPAGGLEEMRRGAELLRERKVLYFDGLLKIALAEAEAAAGDLDRALAILDEGLTSADRLGHRTFEAELHRARGEALLKRDFANPAPAEEAFLTAIAVAKQQGTRSFELRAVLSLANLYQSTSRLVDAHAVLAPALEGFPPTPEMPELSEAQALLAALAEMEQVKSAEGQRQRRLHLQTAYGQAMIMAKGFAAEETKTAFAHASELAAKVDDFAERFAACHGQWTLALVRGEQRRVRELAFPFLKEAEDAVRLVEVGVARRGLALSCLFTGDFLEARTHCERALEVCDPQRDRETRERFSDDTGTLAMSCLAVTSWQLGEVDLARELIDEANRRGTELGHAPSMAHPLAWKSELELFRGDAAAALSAAEALNALSREHGMPFWGLRAKLVMGWARGRLFDAAAGAEELRRVLALSADHGAISDLWFHTVLLAELEAETLGMDVALTHIDEALALADRVEYRCNLALAHRLRGELLLKRDPSNPAPAEEAFQRAIAVAKKQEARSWGLRAALSLARLYQSSGRPADAHAVLAPALKGFAPTAEMPEIAEAQALLVAIEAGAHVRHE